MSIVSQENTDSSGSSAQPFAWCIARFDKISGKLLQRDTVYSPVEAAVMANLTHSFHVVVTELYDGQQPDVLAALKRLIAVDDAHSTLHAPDGDDIARMVEHAEAHNYARSVLAALEAATVQP